MVSVFFSKPSNVALCPGQGHVVFLGKVLYPYSSSHHPGVQMGTSRLNAGSNPVM